MSIIPGHPVTFYINGQPGTENGPPASAKDILPGATDLEILVGRDLEKTFFGGVLQELRLWGLVRSNDDVVKYMNRSTPADSEGLVGYWPLNVITSDSSPVRALDKTYNGNHLLLGGIHTDFEPALVEAQLPNPPVKIPGSALTFDGENDYLVVTDPSNMGLGAGDRATVEFWFKADEDKEGKQILYTQGDGEAGVNVFLQVRWIALSYAYQYFYLFSIACFDCNRIQPAPVLAYLDYRL